MAYTPIPEMHILIEDFGVKTQDLCMNCRARNRFNFMHELVVTEATSKTPREFYRVCPWCDTADETHGR